MSGRPSIEVALEIGAARIAGEALPDTGFDGDVVLPRGICDAIDREPMIHRLYDAWRAEHLELAWDGLLHLDGASFSVVVVAGEELLIGRRVLNRIEICFEFGERVRLRFEREEGE